MYHFSILRLLPVALAVATLPMTALAAGQQATVPASTPHERVLSLEGGQNFRDLGGYRTTDGLQVKWGLLYRSGEMNGLTERDFERLRALGIATVLDFRTTRERTAAPVKWPSHAKPAVFADDYEMSGDFGRLMQPGLTGDQAADLMASGYTRMPTDFAGQYRRMFAELAAGRAPLAFNCTAGKDRTGLAAALVLTALGVPYETVMEDYLLSNQHFQPSRMANVDPQTAAFMSRLSPGAIKAMMGVDERYLDAAFAAMRSQPGGVKGYLRNQLGVDDAMVKALRARYLERA